MQLSYRSGLSLGSSLGRGSRVSGADAPKAHENQMFIEVHKE